MLRHIRLEAADEAGDGVCLGLKSPKPAPTLELLGFEVYKFEGCLLLRFGVRGWGVFGFGGSALKSSAWDSSFRI